MSNPDNPLAFPRPQSGENVCIPSQQGMTLRDYFAAHILAGILAGKSAMIKDSQAISFAEASYVLADAMLAERIRNNGK